MLDGSSTCTYKCLNGTCVKDIDDCRFPTVTTPNFDFTTPDSHGNTDTGGKTAGKM